MPRRFQREDLRHSRHAGEEKPPPKGKPLSLPAHGLRFPLPPAEMALLIQRAAAHRLLLSDLLAARGQVAAEWHAFQHYLPKGERLGYWTCPRDPQDGLVLLSTCCLALIQKERQADLDPRSPVDLFALYRLVGIDPNFALCPRAAWPCPQMEVTTFLLDFPAFCAALPDSLATIDALGVVPALFAGVPR